MVWLETVDQFGDRNYIFILLCFAATLRKEAQLGSGYFEESH